MKLLLFHHNRSTPTLSLQRPHQRRIQQIPKHNQAQPQSQSENIRSRPQTAGERPMGHPCILCTGRRIRDEKIPQEPETYRYAKENQRQIGERMSCVRVHARQSNGVS